MSLLPLSDVVNVSVSFQQTAASTVDFHALLIIGPTQNVITLSEGIRLYRSMEDVGHDFSTTDPEYMAAQVYFAQSPQPDTLYIGTKQTNETPLAALQRLLGVGNWYGCFFALSLSNDDILGLSGTIEASAATTPRLLFLTTSDVAVLDQANTNDIASQLYAQKRTRTIMQYSSTSAYAAISLFGVLATVDYNKANSALTLKFKKEPGINPEQLSRTQVETLKAKHVNMYVSYAGNNTIVQEGVTSGDMYIDERSGIDWLVNAVQLSVFNLFYANRKIPGTNSGLSFLHAAIVQALEGGVTNGLLAPNSIWSGGSVGSLSNNTALPSGYYVEVTETSDLTVQQKNNREASAVIGCVLAGAFHSANIVLNVER